MKHLPSAQGRIPGSWGWQPPCPQSGLLILPLSHPPHGEYGLFTSSVKNVFLESCLGWKSELLVTPMVPPVLLICLPRNSKSLVRPDLALVWGVLRGLPRHRAQAGWVVAFICLSVLTVGFLPAVTESSFDILRRCFPCLVHRPPLADGRAGPARPGCWGSRHSCRS